MWMSYQFLVVTQHLWAFRSLSFNATVVVSSTLAASKKMRPHCCLKNTGNKVPSDAASCLWRSKTSQTPW